MRGRVRGEVRSQGLRGRRRRPGGELTAAAVRDAQAAAPWMPTTIAGLLAAVRDLQAPPGATPRKPRRRSSTGVRRRSFEALSPEARFVSKRFDAARRGSAVVRELNPRVSAASSPRAGC